MALFWIDMWVGLMSNTQWDNLLARNWFIGTFWQKIKGLVDDDDDNDDDDFIFWKRGRCLDIWVVTEAKSRTWGGKTNWKTTTMVADNSFHHHHPSFYKDATKILMMMMRTWIEKLHSEDECPKKAPGQYGLGHISSGIWGKKLGKKKLE